MLDKLLSQQFDLPRLHDAGTLEEPEKGFTLTDDELALVSGAHRRHHHHDDDCDDDDDDDNDKKIFVVIFKDYH